MAGDGLGHCSDQGEAGSSSLTGAAQPQASRFEPNSSSSRPPRAGASLSVPAFSSSSLQWVATVMTRVAAVGGSAWVGHSGALFVWVRVCVMVAVDHSVSHLGWRGSRKTREWENKYVGNNVVLVFFIINRRLRNADFMHHHP